jgi:hypothetical protein
LFLKRAGLVAAAGMTMPGCDILFRPDAGELARAVTGLLDPPALASEIGRLYLESREGEPGAMSLETLLSALLERIGMDANRPLFLSRETLRGALADAITGDFAGEDTAAVAGWILAETECLMCAIAWRIGREPA